MREILFRGKSTDNGEWVEGTYFPPANTLISYKLELIDGVVTFMDFCVIPETVGQFTGLTDKNGKKIFEGDIVQAHFRTNHSKQIFRVTFDDGMFIFNNGYVKLPVRGIYGIKVIGNIHDDPELLQSESNE